MASHQNPFTLSDEDVGNPFADPTISHAVGSSDYSTTGNMTASTADYAQPYTLPSTTSSFSNQSHPLSYGSSKVTAPTPTFDGNTRNIQQLNAREEELRKREEELAAREAALQREQQEMRQHGFKPPNWPPFYPLVYHNIDDEVPEQYRPTAHKIFKLWLATAALLLWNMIACLTLLVSHPDNMPNVASDFGVSLVYVPFIIISSFYLWYRPVYLAYARNTALYFYVYLLFGGLHVLFAFYMAVGIPGSGGAGFINTLAVITNGKIVAGVFCAIALGGWICNGLWCLWMWKSVHSHNSAAGHTLQSARQEAIGVGVRAGMNV
ncbi:hypothetical protein HDV00_001220 [Rhizophlyctis rosea]|nr:hypothetical protein HDV00_001220 [Rhizophlyctis rosea]